MQLLPLVRSASTYLWSCQTENHTESRNFYRYFQKRTIIHHLPISWHISQATVLCSTQLNLISLSHHPMHLSQVSQGEDLRPL